jgi:hypothetical protein
VVRLLLLLALTGFMVLLSKLETSEVQLGYHLGMALGGSLFAALFCLPMGRFRNLRSFSKGALVLTSMMTLSTLSSLTRKGAARDEPWPASAAVVDRHAPTGNFTLRVPESWRFESRSNSTGEHMSLLYATNGSAVAWATEKGTDFAADFGLSQYAEVMRKVYEQRLATNIGPGELVTLGNVPAMKFAFDGTRDGVRAQGYLYAAKGRRDFCWLAVFSPPSRFERVPATLERVVASAIIH